jgi:DNA-directed RNA polymerase specialized sigma24 family protein
VTARRECLRVLRRAGRELPVGDDAALEPATALDDSPDEGLLESERQADFWRAFGCLSCRCQSLLRLLMREPSLTYEEISELLAMPIGSIGPTRGRCLERLRQHVGEAGATYQANGRPLVVR